MRLCVPVLLLVTFLWACDVWPQSLIPDNHYVLKGGAAYITGYPYVPQNGRDRLKAVRGQVYLGMNSLQFRFCSMKGTMRLILLPKDWPRRWTKAAATVAERNSAWRYASPTTA